MLELWKGCVASHTAVRPHQWFTSLQADSTRSRSAPHEGHVLASACSRQGWHQSRRVRCQRSWLMPLLNTTVQGSEQKHCLPGRAVMGLSHSPLMTVCKATAAVQQHGQKMVQATPQQAHPLPGRVKWWLYYVWSLLFTLLRFWWHLATGCSAGERPASAARLRRKVSARGKRRLNS